MKSLDEERSKAASTSIVSLFSDHAEVSRKKLVLLIESILLEDFESIGRKTRDILWRKVYYDPIATSKKVWKKRENDLTECETNLLCSFIKNGIKHYKTLILKFEDNFNLDIRYIIDFSIIANGADAFEKRSEKEIYTVNETNHAIETIHNFLVSLGDLHRYCIEFKFAEKDVSINSNDIKQLAANYYTEAFKLNPKIGSPHNQLGTLHLMENFEIDSIFHYLYSLCSNNPVELSETNVSRIFQRNNESLVLVEPSSEGFNIKDFMMQVILLIDIFFYDKEIADFNSICFSVLMNFKEYLNKSRRNSQADITFQLTSIFMLCLLKLKMKKSPKVHSLNAFLVAFCARIVDTTIEKIDDFVADHKTENLEFCEEYNKKFHEFDRKIKGVRETNRGKCSRNGRDGFKDSGIDKNGSGNSQKDGSGSNHLSLSGESKNTMSQASEKSQPGQVKIAKRPPAVEPNQNPVVQTNNNNNRRRRKRRGMTASSSEESETESIFSEDNHDNDSMNSDFDSYDEDEDYVKMRFSSGEDSESGDENDDDDEEELGQNDSGSDDILIENEEIVYNDSKSNEKERMDFYDSDGKNDDDILIEDEEIVFRDRTDEELAKILRMKYKKKYTKVDPNLILEFNQQYESWIKSLKILFDWLQLDGEIIIGCYRSNPEFINKIMRLINLVNIDIFTRKIFFERSMIKFKNVREDLRFIFDSRHQIATSEDTIFKKFALFEELQQPIDWNLNYKLQITHEEDIVLRNFKIIDFGFYLCKTKKFNYSFCARSRIFIEKQSRRRRRRRGGERERERRRKFSDERSGRKFSDERGRKDNNNRERGGVGRRSNRKERRRRDRGERKKQQMNSESDRFEHLSIKTHSQGSHEEYPSIEKSNQVGRKGYLKNNCVEKENQDVKQSENDKKNEMMGKLGKEWLKNEVKTLESRSNPINTNLTPYLMLDTKSLTDYLYIVKHLVKSKKFVVLIPKAGNI